MDITEVAPGHHPAMTNAAYHSAPGISKSHLDDIAPECGKSPCHYWEKRINPDHEPEEPSASLIIGSAFHDAVLQPDMLEESFIIEPQNAPNRPSQRQRDAKKPSPDTLEAIAFWDQFNANAVGKRLLTLDQHEIVIRMRDAVLRHPVAGPLIRDAVYEQTYFAQDPETGALVKCRPDIIKGGNLMIDLKSTDDASAEGFGRSAANFRYDVQSAWYPDVYKLATDIDVRHFVFIAVEKKPPNAIGIYYVEPAQIEYGRRLARRDLHAILHCRQTKAWPDFAISPMPLQMPAWARRDAL